MASNKVLAKRAIWQLPAASQGATWPGPDADQLQGGESHIYKRFVKVYLSDVCEHLQEPLHSELATSRP